MFKRAFLATVIAGGIAFAPVAATADTPDYPPTESRIACLPLVFTPGLGFKVFIFGELGLPAYIQVTFDGPDGSIAGTVTSAPKTIEATGSEGVNAAVFDVTVPMGNTAVDVVGYVDGEEADELLAGTCSLVGTTTTGGELPSEEPTPTPTPSESVMAGITPEPVATTITKVSAGTVGTDASLSGTGFQSTPLALGAGLLLVAGAATVVIAARRTATEGKTGA